MWFFPSQKVRKEVSLQKMQKTFLFNIRNLAQGDEDVFGNFLDYLVVLVQQSTGGPDSKDFRAIRANCQNMV